MGHSRYPSESAAAVPHMIHVTIKVARDIEAGVEGKDRYRVQHAQGDGRTLDVAPLAGSDADEFADPLPVPAGFAPQHLVALRTAEVEVDVVFPGEPDATVDLEALAGDRGVSVAHI